ncbi:hypothetical protein [Rhizobium terrae]|uniref:hypothetical protein n=1 Tax=Rhizobium terrae TaxID=2171756 RepID=UPI0013C2B0D2|nr:hypothetical protein [Rhizobium terrae]
MANADIESSGPGDNAGSKLVSGLRRLGASFSKALERITQPGKAVARAEKEAQDIANHVRSLATQKNKPSALDFDRRRGVRDGGFSSAKLAALGSQRHLNELILGSRSSFAQEIQSSPRGLLRPDPLHSNTVTSREQPPALNRLGSIRLGRSFAQEIKDDVPDLLHTDSVSGGEQRPSLGRAASLSSLASTVVSDSSNTDSKPLDSMEHPNPLRSNPFYGGGERPSLSRASLASSPPSLVSDDSSIASKPHSRSSPPPSVYRLASRSEIHSRGPIIHNGKSYAERPLLRNEVTAKPITMDHQNSRAFVGRDDRSGPDCVG